MSTLWIGIILALLIAGALLGRWLARQWRRLVMLRIRRQGRQGELDAVELLEEAGYRVLQEQLTQECSVLVDGEPRPYRIRADYLVTRDGKRFVAEVKTGEKAPDPTYDRTRRQLLEYSICYPVDGVLLVDMTARRLHTIAWKGAATAPPTPVWRQLLVPVAVALGIGILVGLLLGGL